jgi:hypothetical protein
MWEARCLTILWASTACYRVSFVFLPLPWRYACKNISTAGNTTYRGRLLTEKLIVAQLVKFPDFYRIRGFTTAFTKTGHFALNQMNPNHTLPLHFFRAKAQSINDHVMRTYAGMVA